MSTVLIVEDNRDIAFLIGEGLKDSGHRSEAAYDGQAALVAAERLRPDAILLDIMLPDIDGYEVARRLRGSARTAAIPLVIMTAFGRVEERAAEIGTPYAIAKPFNLADLVAIVERASGADRRKTVINS